VIDAVRRRRCLVDRLSAVLAAGLLLVPTLALAQDSKSAALATELAGMLDQMKLDTVAGQYSDGFVGALYIPGTQLLVVTAKGQAPYFQSLLQKKAYKDVYADLNGMADASRVFISDPGANGLHFKREKNQTFDTVDAAGKTIAFDGDWDKAKISEQEYTKQFQSFDQQYSDLLQSLIATLKKPS
jgi:hypothetical protein